MDSKSTAYQVIMTISHDCKLRSLQERLQKEFSVYCTQHFDYFMFANILQEDEIAAITSIFNYSIQDLTIYKSIKQQTVCIAKCTQNNRTHLMHYYNLIFENWGIVFDYPRITDQGEQYVYHCLDSKTHAAVIEALKDATKMKIDAIHEYPPDDYFGNLLLSMPDLAKEITKKQTQVLFEAYRGGYYEIPRKIKMVEVAEKIQKSRYNAEKLLRLAENKIMNHIYPFF